MRLRAQVIEGVKRGVLLEDLRPKFNRIGSGFRLTYYLVTYICGVDLAVKKELIQVVRCHHFDSQLL